MPVLRDPRYEDFAQRLASNEDRTRAYADAGFDGNRSNARRASNRPDVRARINELMARASELADIGRAKTLVELDRVASANIADFFDVVPLRGGKKGEFTLELKNIVEMPRSVTAAIASLDWDKDGRPKLKLFDKVSALDKLGRNQGLWQADNAIHVVTLADLISASYAAKHPEALLPKVIEGEVVR